MTKTKPLWGGRHGGREDADADAPARSIADPQIRLPSEVGIPVVHSMLKNYFPSVRMKQPFGHVFPYAPPALA
jgi:hypothetical protein